MLSAKTAKFTSLENLYEYGTRGYVVIPQYCFLIPSNFMNTIIPQSTDIIKYSSLMMFFNLFSAKIILAYT